MNRNQSITIRTAEEITILREAGKILASIIKELKCSLKPGMTTNDVDVKAENLIAQANVTAAFKGYRGFPASACVSVNEQVVHGIPSDRVLNEGDIVSVDVGIIHKGFYSDTAFTGGVGEIDDELQKLLEVTEQSLLKGIEMATVGNHLSDISHAIQNYVEVNNFSVVRDFVGHGIGTELHESPEIPNFGPPHQGPELKEGMVFAIEPMVNVGGWKTMISKDEWTVITKDEKPSAHFEHSIAILENGPEILTK